jgi:hypothetical protein
MGLAEQRMSVEERLKAMGVMEDFAEEKQRCGASERTRGGR